MMSVTEERAAAEAYRRHLAGECCNSRAMVKCVFGCGNEGTIDMSDARHEGIGFGCLTCIIRAARKKLVERLIKEARRSSAGVGSPD